MGKQQMNDTLYATALKHIESQLSDTENELLHAVLSHKWGNGYEHGKQNEEQSQQLGAANVVICELQAEIERLKEAKLEIKVGSWWKRRPTTGFPPMWYRVSSAADGLVQITYGSSSAEDKNGMRKMAPFDPCQLWEFCTPCDPPEWYTESEGESNE